MKIKISSDEKCIGLVAARVSNESNSLRKTENGTDVRILVVAGGGCNLTSCQDVLAT